MSVLVRVSLHDPMSCTDLCMCMTVTLHTSTFAEDELDDGDHGLNNVQQTPRYYNG